MTLSVILVVAVMGFIVVAAWGVHRSYRGGVSVTLTGGQSAALLVAIAVLLPLSVWHAWSVQHVPKQIQTVIEPFPGAGDPMDATGPQGLAIMMDALNRKPGAAAKLKNLRTDLVRTYM